MTSVNTSQIAEWNAASGEKWVRHQARMDELYAGYAKLVLGAANLDVGEVALDVGTGCGAVALGAAHLVGPAGSVVGVDISERMLARASARAHEDALSNARFELGDVQTYDLGKGRYDAVLSRFGVMFFDDPVAAFENVHAALRAKGRLAFAAWQSIEKNPWVVLVSATLSGLVELPSMDSSTAPGPFSFAERERIHQILTLAGFTKIDVEPVRVPLAFGATAEEAAGQLVLLGPASRALSKADASVKERAVELVRDAIASHVTTKGVVLDSNVWIVTALHGA